MTQNSHSEQQVMHVRVAADEHQRTKINAAHAGESMSEYIAKAIARRNEQEEKKRK